MTVFHAVMFCIATAPPPTDWQGSSANYPAGEKNVNFPVVEINLPKNINTNSSDVGSVLVHVLVLLCANIEKSQYLNCLCATEMVNFLPGKGEVCTATSAMIALHCASQQLVSDSFGPVVACY